MKKLEKHNIDIEDYVKLTEAKEKFAKYSLAVEYKLNNIKAELEINMNMTFQGVKENIEYKAIYFEQQEKVQREDLEEFFSKWRLINREKMKDAIFDIENEFRDGLTHDYFRNKLKNVVSAD